MRHLETVLSVLAGVACRSAGSVVQVQLQTAWAGHHLLHQVFEAIHAESEKDFWKAVEFPHWHYNATDRPQEQYEALLRGISSAGILQNDGELDSLKFSLALREASPRLESIASVYREPSHFADRGSGEHEGCESWVEISNKSFCSTEGLASHIDALDEHASISAHTFIYPFDHVYPWNRTFSPRATAILYASASTISFQRFHSILSGASQREMVQYVLRWKPSADVGASRPGGWGVALDLKKTDYLVIDDRLPSSNLGRNTSSERSSRRASTSDQPEQTGKPSSAIFLPVAAPDLADISLKAASFILGSADPLLTLQNLSQDFPLHANDLVTRWSPEVPEKLDAELLKNSMNKLEAGQSAFWINGLQIMPHDLNAFPLARIMRRERRMLLDLQSLGLKLPDARRLLNDPYLAIEKNQPGRDGIISAENLGEIFDVDDVAEGSNTILWWNDLENDSRYSGWSRKVSDYLRPTYPGQLHMIARNSINVILCMDLTKTSALAVLSNHMAPFIKRQLPIRWGLVPIVGHSSVIGSSHKMAVALWQLVATAGRAKALHVVSQFAATDSHDVDVSAFLRVATQALAEHSKPFEMPVSENGWELLAASSSEFSWRDYLARVEVYGTRLDLTPDEPTSVGMFFVNGVSFPLDENFRSNLQQAISLQLQFIQQQIYFAKITDAMDMGRYFYNLPTARSRRSSLLAPSKSRPLRVLNLVRVFEEAGYGSLTSVSKSLSRSTPTSSVIIVGDLASEAPLLSVQAAVQSLSPRTDAELTCIHEPGQRSINPGPISIAGCSRSARGQRQALTKLLGLRKGDVGVLINGRVILKPGAFTSEDFETIISYEQSKRLGPVHQAVEELVHFPRENTAALSSVLWSALLPATEAQSLVGSSADRSFGYKMLQGDYSSITRGNETTALFDIGVVLDPVTEIAQVWSSLLMALSKRGDVYIKIWLNPARQVSTMPIKRLYRHVLTPSLEFDNLGHERAPTALFPSIPSGALLSTSMHAHPSWMILPKRSLQDLDNIVGGEADTVDATFEVVSLLVEGHAREALTHAPPRGLQFDLLTSDRQRVGDTIVMANLGYFQFKARPGLYLVMVHKGRSAETFVLEALDNKPVITDSSTAVNILALTSFEGVTLFPILTRKPGMEAVDLLTDGSSNVSDSRATLWARAQKSLSALFSKPAYYSPSTAAKINIFTVASGLLYERMAYIMCLSVMKHTSSSVKFWFIGQFLSPSFRAFIPHLAKAYGFEYELVTYQWPHWLRSQKEKQRVIWGYKILFLDVLFPLNLDRIIFVDSDQIVRVDLQNLVDMDLHGAPYAYAPMGTDREETKGFRFWEHGYWKEALHGRPYHISALYLVDLKRFREIGAGDILRQHYQTLSTDPGSLANLDQDLPNNLQDHLPIHTLDQSWLWCETWCSDAGLAEAKTIDLCNNPLTHEPKLARARRLLPEWDLYDQEVASLAAQIQAMQGGDIGTEVIIGDASNLGQAQQQVHEWKQEVTLAHTHEDL